MTKNICNIYIYMCTYDIYIYITYFILHFLHTYASLRIVEACHPIVQEPWSRGTFSSMKFDVVPIIYVGPDMYLLCVYIYVYIIYIIINGLMM